MQLLLPYTSQICVTYVPLLLHYTWRIQYALSSQEKQMYLPSFPKQTIHSNARRQMEKCVSCQTCASVWPATTDGHHEMSCPSTAGPGGFGFPWQILLVLSREAHHASLSGKDDLQRLIFSSHQQNKYSSNKFFLTEQSGLFLKCHRRDWNGKYIRYINLFDLLMSHHLNCVF